MATPMDYYALLGVPHSASTKDIQEAYKEKVQIWRKRATLSPNDSSRDEAAQRLQLLEQALGTLSNTQQRTVYDQQLPSTPIATSIVPAASAHAEEVPRQDLIERAEHYLAQEDYAAAASVARQATIQLSDSAQSWLVLSQAHAGLRQFEDAIYEAKRAIELEPADGYYSFYLGSIYKELSQWNDALTMFQQAAQRDPDNLLCQLEIGGIQLELGKLADALSIIKRVNIELPDDETACHYHAQVLIAMAEAVPRDKSADGYAVTTMQEIQEMRNCLTRASNIRHLDQETKQHIYKMQAYLHKMEGHTFHIPLVAGALLSGIGSFTDGGCLSILIVVSVMTAFVGAPVLVLMWAMASFSDGSVLGGLFLLLCSGGLGYLWYRSVWVPRWKVNGRLRTGRTRYLS